jgi:hypothetical protein|nr:MAG TPA: hypothetical protein [Bacteriophage sp.]
MAIFYSPYNTTIGSKFNTDRSQTAIRQSLGLNYPWMKINEANKTIFIYPNSVVPTFSHPLTIETVKGLTYTICDLSSFIRERQEGEYTVANKPLFSLQTIRTVLTADLINNGTRSIKSLSPNVVKTYVDLITSSLSMVFSLNNEEVLALRALSGWMYYSMLHSDLFSGELEFDALVAKLAREINIPSSFLYRYLDQVFYKSVGDFLEKIKQKINNPAVQKINEGLFYTVIAKNLNANVWIGLEKQEILAMSVEHIPTFVATLVICLSEQVFKNAGLTKMALRNFTRDKANFILAVNSIVNDY